MLPSRLKAELNLISEYLLEGKDIRSNELIEKHADWVDSFRTGYQSFTKDNLDEILEKEVGLVFERVLEDAGVFKYDEAGRAGFKRFLTSMGFEPVSQ